MKYIHVRTVFFNDINRKLVEKYLYKQLINKSLRIEITTLIIKFHPLNSSNHHDVIRKTKNCKICISSYKILL